MADGPAETVANVTAEAVAEAASKAGETAAAVVAASEAAVAVAEKKVEAAEAVAETLTAAAIQSKLGEKIADVEQEVDEWESAVENQISDLRQQSAAISQRQTILEKALAELKTAKVTTVETSLTSPSSTPAPGEKVTTVEVVQPLAAKPGEKKENTPAAPRRAWI